MFTLLEQSWTNGIPSSAEKWNLRSIVNVNCCSVLCEYYYTIAVNITEHWLTVRPWWFIQLLCHWQASCAAISCILCFFTSIFNFASWELLKCWNVVFFTIFSYHHHSEIQCYVVLEMFASNINLIIIGKFTQFFFRFS